jgi:hypothetical protein
MTLNNVESIQTAFSSPAALTMNIDISKIGGADSTDNLCLLSSKITSHQYC